MMHHGLVHMIKAFQQSPPRLDVINKPIIIAMLDSGIYRNHPKLKEYQAFFFAKAVILWHRKWSPLTEDLSDKRVNSDERVLLLGVYQFCDKKWQTIHKKSEKTLEL